MTDEELEKLKQDISGEIERLTADPDSPPDKAGKRHILVLEARRKALDKIKTARESGNIDREAKACMEYAMITEYAEKNPWLFMLMRVRLATWPRI